MFSLVVWLLSAWLLGAWLLGAWLLGAWLLGAWLLGVLGVLSSGGFFTRPASDCQIHKCT
jgi:hypothetical protein